jgi:hypothetical protein
MINRSRRFIALGILSLCVSSSYGEYSPTTNTFSSTFTNALVVPDNSTLGVTDEIYVVAPPLRIIDVTVSLEFSSPDLYDPPFNGDYYVYLQHSFDSDNRMAVLLNRVGMLSVTNGFGYGDTGFDINLMSSGKDVHYYRDNNPSYDQNGRLVGNWEADGRLTTPPEEGHPREFGLDDFYGMNANGIWTLFAADLNEGGVGQIDSWSLTVTVVPEPGSSLLFLAGCSLIFFSRRIYRSSRSFAM